jgi:hypothetical protein
MRGTFFRSALVLCSAAGSLATSGPLFAQEQTPPDQNQTPQQSTQEQATQEVLLPRDQLLPQQQQGQQLPAGQVPAVLKSREVNFIYRTTNSMMACDELRNRVATVLREVGARDDVQVTARECDTFITPDNRGPRRSDPKVSGTFQPGVGGGNDEDLFKRPIDRQMDRQATLTHADRFDRYKSQTTPIHIELMMPTLITPEVMQEVERDKARRALVSRVQGNQAAALDDPIFFAAARREVTLSHETIELEPMDCELLDQMSRSVFRELGLKVTSASLACDSRSSFRPQMKVEALLPVGYMMPGEQRAKKKKDDAAARKLSQTPSQ